jgi:tetratricopeptide (TPR) repeat protein
VDIIERITVLVQEGLTLASVLDNEHAIAKFDKAEELMKRVNEDDAKEFKIICMEGKALALKNCGRNEESNKLYKETVDIRSAMKHDDVELHNASQISLALTLLRLEEFDKAFAIADEFIDMPCYGDEIETAVQLITVAKIYENDLDKNYKKERKMLLRARKLMVPHVREFPEDLLDIQYMLANIEEQCEHSNKKAMFELEKAWKIIINVGIENISLVYAWKIPNYGTALEEDVNTEEFWLWRLRYAHVTGIAIDTDEAEPIAIHNFLELFLNLYLTQRDINKEVTVERALKCIKIAKSLSMDELEIAKAQCLAGCLLAEIGKTKETARKSARLIKTALREVKKSKEDFVPCMIAIGEGCIANYHFLCEDYALAANWYAAGLEGIKKCNPLIKLNHGARFSERLAECRKHML